MWGLKQVLFALAFIIMGIIVVISMFAGRSVVIGVILIVIHGIIWYVTKDII
jgi:hypothetical protein